MIQRVKVNLIPSYNLILPVIHLKQYDRTESSEGKQIELELYSGSDVYEVPSGAIVTIQGTKPDKTGYQYEATNVEGNLVVMDIKEQMTVLSGNHYAELRITKNGSILNSTKVVMDIDSSALQDDTAISDTDLPLLQKGIDALETILETAKTVASDAKSASTSATNAKESEENAKLSEINAKTSETNSKTSEVNAKSSEENAKESETNAKESEENASASATTAKDAETNASTSATNASKSEESAKATADLISSSLEQIAENKTNIESLDNLLNRHIYGFKRQRSNANYSTRITYTDESVGFTPVTVDLSAQTQDLGSWQDFIEKIARPVMLKYNGLVDYELCHTDTSKKVDGTTASDIDNSSYGGNAMVEFREYKWVSRKTVGDYDYVRFANYQADESFVNYAFIDDDGVEKPTFYFSMFSGASDGTRLRSIAGMEILRSNTASAEMSLAKANGIGYNTGTWAQINYIWDLLTLLGKTDGLQETFGRGICDLDWNSGTNPFGWKVGQTKSKGCFFGQSGGANPVRTLWIEDLWGRAWDRYAGLVNDNGTFKVKLHGPYPTPTDTASTYSEFVNTGLTTPAEGFVKEVDCSEYGFLPQVTGGSANTYFCDYFYKNDSGVKYVLVGGHWSSGSSCGRYVDVVDASSLFSVTVGSRLSQI